MDFRERVKAYIANEGISKSEFERNSGLSNGYINNVKGNPSETKLRGILSAYPNLNATWLLTGEGEMLKSQLQSGVHIDRSVQNIGRDQNIISGPNAHINTDENLSTLREDLSALKAEVSVLRAENSHLQHIIAEKDALIKEKERLIGVLMGKT